MPVTIFICYAEEDEILLNKLKAHLRPLQRQNLAELWYDHNVRAGAAWEPEIKKYLNTAQIILLLLSPDFMDSDYCYGVEMKRALERHERGEAKAIPILLRPVYWHAGALGKLQALPANGKAVTDPTWHDLDTALHDIAERIRKVVKQLADQTKSEAGMQPPLVKRQTRKGRSPRVVHLSTQAVVSDD